MRARGRSYKVVWVLRFFLLWVSVLGAAPKDQRIEIVHIANLRGDYQRLARLLTHQDERSEDIPTLYLIGNDVLGKSAYGEVDRGGREFVEDLVDLADGVKSVIMPGRSDFTEPLESLQAKFQILKKSKLKILATNYEGPLKGISDVEVVSVAGARIAVFSLLSQDSFLTEHKISNPQVALKAKMKDWATKVDGIVVVTNLSLPEQRLIAKMISGLPGSEKVFGIFGAEPREKAAEIVAENGKKVLVHQASAASNQVTALSVYWDEAGERQDKFRYEDLPQATTKRLSVVKKLDRALEKKFGKKIGTIAAPLSGAETVDDLFDGVSPLGQVVANSFRDKYLSSTKDSVNVVGLSRTLTVGQRWASGDLTEADLMKTLPLNAGLQAISLKGQALEAIIRQDQAQQTSRQETALQWSDNLRISGNGAIYVGKKKLDPQADYIVVLDSILLGGASSSDKSLVPSSRWKPLFGSRPFKNITPKDWTEVTERSAVRDFVGKASVSNVEKPPVQETGAKTTEEPSNKAVSIDPRETRYLPLQAKELERIRSHPVSVIWVESFPEGSRPSDLLIVDATTKMVVGGARLVSFAFGSRKEALGQLEVGYPVKWTEENAGPEDKGKYYGLLISDFKPFSKPIEISRITDATGAKQFSLRNRVQPATLDWLKAKGAVQERPANPAKLIRDAVKLFGEPEASSSRLAALQERKDVDIAMMGVYHGFAQPQARPVSFEVTGAQLKAFFNRNDSRLFQTSGLKFDRRRKLESINGEPVRDRKKYTLVSDFADETRDFEKTFAEGGKSAALESLRDVATDRALSALKHVVDAAEEEGVSKKVSKTKKASEDADEVLTIKPIRKRTKEMRRELFDRGILMFPDGERIDTGGEVEEMPEDILFQRSYKRIIDRLNPLDAASVELIQKAVSVLAQIEVLSRLTPESLQVVRETVTDQERTFVEGVLSEIGTFPEDLREEFKNPLITLRLSGYRPTVEEADLLTRYYRAKPEDYEPIFERWVEFPPMVEVLRDKLKVTPLSFFTSPSSSTLQHHDPVQHFPNGQVVHDENVLTVLASRLEQEGYDKPTIEGMMLAMLAHDGWSHEPSPTNWFFKQFGLAGSRAVLKGSVDLITLFLPDFQEFLSTHPHVKREELSLFAKQFESIKSRIGKLEKTNLRSDIKRMMISSPFLALSDLKPGQETWFIKNLAAYVCVQIVGPKAYEEVKSLQERGVQDFSVREIVRRLIDEQFGGLDGADPSNRSVLSRTRKSFSEKGAEWIENKVLDYVLCNAFGPVLEKRFDFQTTFVPVAEVLKQALPRIPEDELKLVHRMLIQEPSFRQPYGNELGRGGWDIGHPARLRAEMERRLPVVCQMIRARGWEKAWLERYGPRWGGTLEETLQNMHDRAVSHMGAYQEAVEVVHRTYANAGVNPDRLLHKLWTWTDVGGYLFNSENVLHQLSLKANQVDTLEALSYLSFERGSSSIPDENKIRIKREVSLTPKEGFVLVDKIRAAPRGKTFLEFKKATGGTIDSTEHLRQWVRVTLKDHRGRDITEDPRLSEMVWDFTYLVPGELDGKFAVNAPALQERKEARKALKVKKRERAEKEKEQDQSNKEKLERYQNVLQAMAENDPESLDRLEADFGIGKGEVRKLLKIKREDDWVEFIRNRARLVSRLDSMTETSRPSHKAIRSRALSGDELALRVAADRVPEIRQNEQEASESQQRDIEEMRREKEAVYLRAVREMIENEPRKFGFLQGWSNASLIGFKLCVERLGEKEALQAVKAGASAGVFDVVYGGNFSLPFFGEEGVEALAGLRLFVNEVSEGRLDGAQSIIRTLRNDPIRVMNFFRRFRVCHLAGIRGLKKMASDAALTSSHVIGIEAVLEEAVDRQGLEQIAGFEVPIEMEQAEKANRAVRVADILLKTGQMIEVKNYTPRSYFDYLQSSILPQFEADIKLHKDNLDRMVWVFRGVDRETGHVLMLFEQIMKKYKIPQKKIDRWMETNLIFRGESGHYPKFDSSQLPDLRVQGCRALNDQWYKSNPVLEDQRAKEVLTTSKDKLALDLKFNWAKPNKEGADLGADLVSFIKGARGELQLAFYDLEEKTVVDEIVSAAERMGAEKISLTLEGSNFQELPWKTAAEVETYLQGLPQYQRREFLEEHADGAEKMSQAQLDRLRERNELRLQKLRQLKKAGLEPKLVRNRNQIMHIKVAIRDRKEALILTANPTESDLYGDFSARRKKLAPANVNASIRLTERSAVEFMASELDQLYKGLTTKTSRDLSGSTQTFVDKDGTRLTIAFTPFSGQGDMANVIQGVLSDLQIEEIWSPQFSLSDSRFYGILYPHIARGAKRHILVDDHFLKYYTKAWQMLGLLPRDPQGRPLVDRVTRLPLEAKPLQEGEFVGTWNGRVDESKGIEAKMHLKATVFKARRPGVKAPVYILAFGSGNASRLGLTTNNEIWTFTETEDPGLFYDAFKAHFQARTQDSQTSDLSIDTTKALLQVLSDSKPKPLIDYLQSDDFGKKSIDSVSDSLAEDFKKVLDGKLALKDFVAGLEKETGLRMRLESQIMLELWRKSTESAEISELMNLTDAVLVPGVQAADQEVVLRKIFKEKRVREQMASLSALAGKPSADFMDFLGSKTLRLEAPVVLALRAEVLKLQGREQIRDLLFDPEPETQVGPKSACKRVLKKVGKKKA